LQNRTLWSYGLGQSSSAPWLLESQLRILLMTGIFALLFVMCCVGSGLCDELITCLQQSYRMCVSSVWNPESTKTRLPRSIWAVVPERKHFSKYQVYTVKSIVKLVNKSYIYWNVHHCNSWKQKTNFVSLAIFFFTSYALKMFRTLIY